MKHVDIACIRREWVSPLLYQHLNHKVVAEEAGEMKCCEAVLTLGLGVHKVFEVGLLLLLRFIILATSVFGDMLT